MVINTTFTHNSVILWRSAFIGGGNLGKPLTCGKSLTNFITKCYILCNICLYILPTISFITHGGLKFTLASHLKLVNDKMRLEEWSKKPLYFTYICFRIFIFLSFLCYL
jgi:hypothetical protein